MLPLYNPKAYSSFDSRCDASQRLQAVSGKSQHEGLRSWVQGYGGLGFRVSCLGLKELCLGLRGFGGVGFRALGIGFRATVGV